MNAPQQRSLRHGRPAFTLVELLVVVAIIGLLAALLLPSLNQARDKARTAQCLSTERGIGLAFAMYRVDHSEYMPPMKRYAPYTGPFSRWEDAGVAMGQALPGWADILVDLKYLGVQHLDCPSAEGKGFARATAGSSYLEPTDHGLEYGVNVFLTERVSRLPADAREGWRIEIVSRPSEGLLIGDSNAPSWTPWHIAPWMQGVFEHLNGAGSNADGRQRHNAHKAINLLYFDGHVETRDVFRLITFDSPPFAAHYGFGQYTIYSSDSTLPPANPTPLWHPWPPYF